MFTKKYCYESYERISYFIQFNHVPTRTTEGPRAWDGDILWTMTSSGHFFQNGQIFVDILKG